MNRFFFIRGGWQSEQQIPPAQHTAGKRSGARFGMTRLGCASRSSDVKNSDFRSLVFFFEEDFFLESLEDEDSLELVSLVDEPFDEESLSFELESLPPSLTESLEESLDEESLESLAEPSDFFESPAGVLAA